MPSSDCLELEGEIIDRSIQYHILFKIKLDSGQEIIGHLSGRMRIHYIKVVAGDRVIVQMTPYDLSKGRIVKRLNNNESKIVS